MSNEIENEIEMPTYTCEKCARTFSQKSHYNAHQNKKFDCSAQTNISVAKALIEKEEIKEMNEKYFDIKDYKLYELSDFMSYAFNITSQNIVNAMAYMNYSQSTKYDGFIFYTNFQHGKYNISEGNNRLYYDILILEPEITLTIYDVYNNKYKFTEKDIKYFPLLQIDNYKYRVEVYSENPIKIITFTNDIRRKIMQTKFHSNNSTIEFIKQLNHFYNLNIKLCSFSDFVENLQLTEMGETLTEIETFSLASTNDEEKKDGFSHPISHINPFVDIIILNESVSAVIYQRTGTFLEITINDMKYLPVYLLKDTIVKLVLKDNKATAITFFKDKIPTTLYDHDSFFIQDGILKKKV